MDPILTLIFSAILSGVIAWFIAEKRIKDEPELYKNRMIFDMKVDLVKDIRELIKDITFNNRHDPAFHSWLRRLTTLNVDISEYMDDDSFIFVDNAIKSSLKFQDNKMSMREFNKNVSGALVNANTCIKVSIGLTEEPAPVPDESS